MSHRGHFELFDHTADLGVRVAAPTLAELLSPAADGLYAAIGEIETNGPLEPLAMVLTGDDASLLLRDFLAELLYTFEQRRRVLTLMDVQEFSDERLAVSGHCRQLDEGRSTLSREVKAITYHELAIRRVPEGYEATYIVDI